MWVSNDLCHQTLSNSLESLRHLTQWCPLMLFDSPTLVILNQGDFPSQRAFGKIWKNFWLSWLGSWMDTIGFQWVYYQIYCNTYNNNNTKTYWVQTSRVPRWGNLDLHKLYINALGSMTLNDVQKKNCWVFFFPYRIKPRKEE